MKIAMVSAYPRKDGVINGGVEGVAYNLIQGMKKKSDLELYVIAPGDKRYSYIEKRDGVIIHWMRRSVLPGFLSYWTIDRLRIHRTLKSIKPDIAHFQGLLGWCIGYKNKYVATIHGVLEKDVLFKGGFSAYVRHLILRFVENYARKRATDIIVINPYVEELFGKIIRGNIWRIVNPVTDIYFGRKRVLNSKKIIYVGRISELKNIEVILEIFKAVSDRESDVTLHLVGAFESEAYYRRCLKYIKNNNLDDRVIFHGVLDVDQLVKQYSQSSVLILMSNQEMAPMVVAEAMAMGVPVIANNICGIKYMIENGVTGYKYDLTMKKLIVSGLCELLTDNILNAKISKNCREYAKQHYGIDNVVNSTISVYRNIINGNV